MSKKVKRVPTQLVPDVCDLVHRSCGYYPQVGEKPITTLIRVPKFLLPKVEQLIAEFRVERAKIQLQNAEQDLQILRRKG